MSIEHPSHAEVERLIAGVPEQLQGYPQFVTWNPIECNGRITKPPVNPLTGLFADSTNSETWGSFHQALNAFSTGRYTGIGFVFAKGDPFSGTDLDHCVKEDGSIEQWAMTIVATLNSYTEYSPSGTGLHILTQATLPEGGRRKENTEVYASGRYFTLTGKHLAGTPRTIELRQAEQMQVYHSLAPREHALPTTVFSHSQADADVLDKAQHARNGKRFTALYRGDIRGFRSKSEADFTLILRLLYWCNDDIAQVRRLFLQSGLYDPVKTESPRGESTYLDVTIRNALQKRQQYS